METTEEKMDTEKIEVIYFNNTCLNLYIYIYIYI